MVFKEFILSKLSNLCVQLFIVFLYYLSRMCMVYSNIPHFLPDPVNFLVRFCKRCVNFTDLLKSQCYVSLIFFSLCFTPACFEVFCLFCFFVFPGS